MFCVWILKKVEENLRKTVTNEGRVVSIREGVKKGGKLQDVCGGQRYPTTNASALR